MQLVIINLERRPDVGMEWYIEQIFTQLPFGVGVAIVIFLGILLIIWLLLPLWVLFIQWNIGKIKDEVRNLVELLEEKIADEKAKKASPPED